jgi:D-alanyl-D-alanine carboxypeptidase (penicillin-binding protein 5/6)
LTRNSKILALILVLLISLAAPLSAPGAPSVSAMAETAPAATKQADAYDEKNPQNLKAADIRGTAAIVMDAKTGRVLFEKDADRRMYPASTTKIITALLALEYGHLDETVTVPKQITKLPKDSSVVPLKAGEKLSLEELLYGLMLPSGNDAAVTIAAHVSGSVDAFVTRMNERAAELGCRDTHFKNPHGYMQEEHYTTARDLALIAREAMKLETFREIASTESYTLPAVSKGKKRKLVSTDEMILETSSSYYPYEIGVKTGSHSKAGHCFVGAAEKDGVTLITVTLKSTEKGMWTDTRRLSEYGFSQYRVYGFAELYEARPLAASIQGADEADPDGGLLRLELAPGGSIDGYRVACLPDEMGDIASALMAGASVRYSRELAAPIRAGEVLGSIAIPAEGGGELTGTLTASRDVAERKPVLPFFGGFTGENQTPSPEAATPEVTEQAATQSAAAPQAGASVLTILRVLLGLFAAMTLVITALRIRRALRRRRRRQLKKRQMAYARSRERR